MRGIGPGAVKTWKAHPTEHGSQLCSLQAQLEFPGMAWVVLLPVASRCLPLPPVVSRCLPSPGACRTIAPRCLPKVAPGKVSNHWPHGDFLHWPGTDLPWTVNHFLNWPGHDSLSNSQWHAAAKANTSDVVSTSRWSRLEICDRATVEYAARL